MAKPKTKNTKPCNACDGTGKEPDMKQWKKSRQLAGIAQKDMAEMLGLKHSSRLSEFERGERKMKPWMAKLYIMTIETELSKL